MKKFILLLTFLLCATIAFSAYLKNVSVELKQPDTIEQENSIESNSINLNCVIKSAIEVVNNFEDYRELPDTLILESEKYTIQQLFNVYIDAILSLYNGGDTVFTINNNIEGPSNLYVNINLDSSVYGMPLEKSEYINLCTHLQKKIPELKKIPKGKKVFSFS